MLRRLKYPAIIFIALALIGFIILLSFTRCSSPRELPTVDQVDLSKYEGKWYEIARLPQSYQEGCECTTAKYEVINEEEVKVVNRCYQPAESEWKESDGKAFPVVGSDNSKLKVQFFWPFKGDYYIIELDKDYQYAMVGNPKRDALWILSRNKRLNQDTYNRLVEKANGLGFPVKKLHKTKHDLCA